jgi:hypothetical protein
MVAAVVEGLGRIAPKRYQAATHLHVTGRRGSGTGM